MKIKSGGVWKDAVLKCKLDGEWKPVVRVLRKEDGLWKQIYRDYNVLLLHMEGSDGSTDFVDSSYLEHSITAYYGAEIDTGQKKFGVSSGYFPGSLEYGYLEIPYHASLCMESGRFTIDCWFRPYGGFSGGWVAQTDDVSNRVQFYFSPSDRYVSFSIKVGGSFLIYLTSGPALEDNIWHHVAIIRGWGNNDNQWAICLNGEAIDTVIAEESWPDLNVPTHIGMYDTIERHIGGHIDELRISKGVARWTSNFTPPSSPYL